MTGPTHVLLGVASVVGFAHASGLSPDGPGMLLVILGSLAPDIDGGGSITKLGTVFKPFLGWRAAKTVDSFSTAGAALLNRLFGHRGFIHSPLLVVLFVCAASWLRSEWLFWFALAYGSHLAGDIITPAGIPVLSPFSPKRVNMASIYVGSAREGVLATLLALFVLVVGWPLLPDGVKATHVEIWQRIVG